MRSILSFCLLFGLVCAGNAMAEQALQDRAITIHNLAGQGLMTELSLEQLQSLGSQEIASAYFDRAMDYQGSRFTVIAFAHLLDRFDPEQNSDAVLLNCVDDYQGILSVRDIRRYDLQLATRIAVQAGLKRPSWLNPLLVLVPDGVSAPFQEKFMTANIRELKFVNREDYYAPLQSVIQKFPGHAGGFQSYQNNCQFCHSLKGVGGNKGGRLLEKYRLQVESDRQRFQSDFVGFHNKENADKQNVKQFVRDEEIVAIGKFLAVFVNE